MHIYVFTFFFTAVSPSRMQMPMRSLPMAMDLPIDSETKNLEIDPKEELMPPTPEPVGYFP